MNQYVTASVVKQKREESGLTQAQLAEALCVSAKTVSKWETGRGYPDITLLEPLAKALGISLIELLSGENIINRNKSSNMLRSRFYVCPVCGNVLFAVGTAVISCCGLVLPPLEIEEESERHEISATISDNEYYVSVNHPMEKDHYISFLAALSDHGIQLVKLYPEGPAEARFRMNRVGAIYAYCNRHGLFRMKPGKK